jgi:hypothetical protein
MSRFLLSLAVTAVRRWTRLYTWGLLPSDADARRAEIASDLWESQRERDAGRGVALALQIWARLLAGMPDDVSWRVEHISLADHMLLRRGAAIGVAVALVATSLLLASTERSPAVRDGRYAECAPGFPPPESTPEFRLRIMNCAGARFADPSAASLR